MAFRSKKILVEKKIEHIEVLFVASIGVTHSSGTKRTDRV